MNSPQFQDRQGGGSGSSPDGQVTPELRTAPNLPMLFHHWPTLRQKPIPIVVRTNDAQNLLVTIGSFELAPAFLVYPLPDPNSNTECTAISKAVAATDPYVSQNGFSLNDFEAIEEHAKYHYQLGILLNMRGYHDYAFWCLQRAIDTQVVAHEMNSFSKDDTSTYLLEYYVAYANAIFHRLEKDPTYHRGYALGLEVLDKARELAFAEDVSQSSDTEEIIENLMRSFEFFKPKPGVVVEEDREPSIPMPDIIQTHRGFELDPHGFNFHFADDRNNDPFKEIPLLLRTIKPLRNLNGEPRTELVLDNPDGPFYLLKFQLGIGFLMLNGYPTGEYPYPDMTFADCVQDQINQKLDEDPDAEIILPDESVEMLFSEHYVYWTRSICDATRGLLEKCYEDMNKAFESLQRIFDYGSEVHQRTVLANLPATIIQPFLAVAQRLVRDGKYCEAANFLSEIHKDVNNLGDFLNTGDFDLSQLIEQAHCNLRSSRMEMLLPLRKTPGGNGIADQILTLADAHINERFREIGKLQEELKSKKIQKFDAGENSTAVA